MKSFKNIVICIFAFLIFIHCSKKDTIKINWNNSTWIGKILSLSEKTGNIQEFPIEMKLTLKDNLITGYYLYSKIKKKIQLKGSLINKKTIELQEINNNVITANFNAKLDNGLFYGNWIETGSKKKLFFYIIQNNYQSIQKKLII